MFRWRRRCQFTIYNVVRLSQIVSLSQDVTGAYSTSGRLSVFSLCLFLSPVLLEDTSEKQLLTKSFSALTLLLKSSLQRCVHRFTVFCTTKERFFHHHFPSHNSASFSHRTVCFEFKRGSLSCMFNRHITGVTLSFLWFF